MSENKEWANNENINVNAPATIAMDEDERFIADLTSNRITQYCSMSPKNEDDEKVLFNAMNNPEKRIGDCINETIVIRDVFCEVVQCVNRDTGETNMCPRVVIIDDKGVGYQAVSVGIFSALKKIFVVKGGLPDTWKKPVKVKVQQITKGDRKMLTFNMV